MPFGRVGAGEFGTYYIGYARTPAVTEQMLRNMFLGDPPGRTDRILDFSTAVTGGLFFVPTVDFLNDLPPMPGAAATTTEPEPATVTDTVLTIPAANNGAADDDGRRDLGDGSLNIGRLDRSPAS